MKLSLVSLFPGWDCVWVGGNQLGLGEIIKNYMIWKEEGRSLLRCSRQLSWELFHLYLFLRGSHVLKVDTYVIHKLVDELNSSVWDGFKGCSEFFFISFCPDSVNGMQYHQNARSLALIRPGNLPSSLTSEILLFIRYIKPTITRLQQILIDNQHHETIDYFSQGFTKPTRVSKFIQCEGYFVCQIV